MKEILSGGLGGVVFGILYLGLSIPLPFALGGAVAGYVAGRLLVSKAKQQGGIDTEGDRQAYSQMIAEGEEKVKTLTSLAASVKKPEIRDKCMHLAQVASKVINDVKESPKDAKRVRQFLNYYLNATCTILERYTELSSRNLNSSEVQAGLAKVEALLDSIQHVFEQQLVAVAQDEILDLDTEIKLLQQTLQLDNLTSAK
ncbi:MAG TPA: 5-bromo-4-chloroindolyl phosphate hydrolysis family protein [Bacteroidota bacterium]|nr:5-bromo-4-chloroindolyl phosphate hydrolysis family protein [Bacteroidota bacterium]